MSQVKEKIQNVFDIIILAIISFIGISKGGFYDTDSTFFELCFIIIFLLYIILRNIFKIKEEKKIDVISILLLSITVFYVLPIVFKNYSDLDDSINEVIRYFCIYILYNIAKRTSNKKIYEVGIVVIGTIICFFGLDGIATRFFEPFLSRFNSGYLDIDKMRMSSTIQYANTFACYILISYIFLCKIISEELNSLIAKKKLLTFNIHYTLGVIFVSSIILSGSKFVFILLVLSSVLNYVLCKRKLNLTVILLLMIEGIVYSNVVSILAINIPSMVIISTVLLYIVNYIFIILLTKIVKKIVNNGLNSQNSKFNIKLLFIASALFFIVSIVIVMNTKIEFTMKYNKNVNSVDKYIYGINGNMNLIEMQINSDKDSKYSIEIWQKKGNGSEEKITNLSYTNTSTGKFVLNVDMDEDAKAIHFRFNVMEGNLKLNYLKINGKTRNLSYAFIPYSLVEKAQDILSGSTSVTDRLVYYKDAIRIITKTKTNFLIGCGGGAFEKLYKSVQTIKYSSTEVHSSYLQIFLEAGVFAFICIVIISIIALIKSKRYVFLAFLMLFIHSLLDLNFSYFFMLCIFALILAMSGNESFSKK